MGRIVNTKCRGRVSRPGGKNQAFRICFGEFVIVRFRDGQPVPYKNGIHRLLPMNACFIYFASTAGGTTFMTSFW